MTEAIVYAYSGAGWSAYPGRQYMLTRALARHCRVVFLELGDRADRSRVMPWCSEPEPGITVVHNAMRLRFSRVGRVAPKVAASIDGGWINGLLRKLGIGQYVYWVSANDPRLLGGMDTRRLAYDCIDPCFEPAAQAAFDRDEQRMAESAKLVFATAESLAEAMRRYHRDVNLLPNGAPDRLPPTGNAATVPNRLAGVNGAVVGYMGTIDWRFDADAVAELARGCPEATICLVGRVNAEQRDAVRRLESLPNVIVVGACSAAEGEAYVARFDVGLIPFTPGPMNDAINPCKMYMHLRTGTPVVSTAIRECVRHSPWVVAATPVRSLAACVRQVLSEGPAMSDQRRAFAANNRWADRADEAMRILRERGLMDALVTNKREVA